MVSFVLPRECMHDHTLSPPEFPKPSVPQTSNVVSGWLHQGGLNLLWESGKGWMLLDKLVQPCCFLIHCHLQGSNHSSCLLLQLFDQWQCNRLADHWTSILDFYREASTSWVMNSETWLVPTDLAFQRFCQQSHGNYRFSPFRPNDDSTRREMHIHLSITRQVDCDLCGKFEILSPFLRGLKGWVAPESNRPFVLDWVSLEIRKVLSDALLISSSCFWSPASWSRRPMLTDFSWVSPWPIVFNMRLASSSKTFIVSSPFGSSLTSSVLRSSAAGVEVLELEIFPSLSLALAPILAALRGFSSVRGQALAKCSLDPQDQQRFSPSMTCPNGHWRPRRQPESWRKNLQGLFFPSASSRSLPFGLPFSSVEPVSSIFLIFGFGSTWTSFLLAWCPICSSSASTCSEYCATVSWVSTVSTSRVFLASDSLKLKSGYKRRTFFVNFARPLISIVASGRLTPTSTALLLHLIHFRSRVVAFAIEEASLGASKALRIADLSVNPPGWYWIMALVKIPIVETALLATTSSFSCSGNAAINIEAARRSRRPHFLQLSFSFFSGAWVNRWMGVICIWRWYHPFAVSKVISHHSSDVGVKSLMWLWRHTIQSP